MCERIAEAVQFHVTRYAMHVTAACNIGETVYARNGYVCKITRVVVSYRGALRRHVAKFKSHGMKGLIDTLLIIGN